MERDGCRNQPQTIQKNYLLEKLILLGVEEQLEKCGGFFFFSKILFIYLFLERWEGREKEKERNVDVQETQRPFASLTPPTGGLACNPGMCPDQNQTSNLSARKLALIPLSHTSQGRNVSFQSARKYWKNLNDLGSHFLSFEVCL